MLVGSLHVSKYMIYNEFLYTSLMQVHLKKYNSLGVSVHHEYPANRHVLGNLFPKKDVHIINCVSIKLALNFDARKAQETFY